MSAGKGDEMKRVLAWGLGLYVLCAVIGKLVEGVGAARCGCAGDCWCRRPGLSTFRWVFPVGHRAAEGDADPAPAADGDRLRSADSH